MSKREHSESAPLGRRYLDSLKERYVLPWSELNTNAARRLAAEWLAAAQVDLKALERDSTLEVRALSQGQTFVPVYTVLWKQPNAQLNQSSHGDELETTAAVQLVLPERRLLLMHVSDPRYILREPLRVPNREQLLQSTDDATMRQMWFTTEAYKTAAEAVLLSEVNRVCSQLNLVDQLPITPAKLTAVNMATPYIADHLQQFGSVRTPNYVFSAFSGNKLSYVSRNFSTLSEGRYLASIKSRYTFPKSQIKPQSAYQLAKAWLGSVSVDVQALERDYKARVSAWDLGDRFVALYTVRWIKGEEPNEICAGHYRTNRARKSPEVSCSGQTGVHKTTRPCRDKARQVAPAVGRSYISAATPSWQVHNPRPGLLLLHRIMLCRALP
jgi:hypothetical protein